MFKKIPGNNEYSINLKEEIVDIYGNIVVLPIEPDGTIEIKLYGKTKNVKKSILKLLAWYEMGNIPDLRKHLDKILFCPVTDKCLRVISGYLPVFTTPVEYGNGFRIIPSYPRYAINIDGTILDTSSNTIVTNIIIDTDGYVSAYIRNPNKNGNRWTRVHRLMALAFLPNTDFITKPFVNHLNGVKSDYSLSNLEWCSAVENAQHAIDTGLTDTSIKMKTRDRYSGEVVIYRSAAELSKKLGLLGVGATKWSFRLPGYLYNKRYEIKSFEDNSPWYYEINTHEPTKAIFTITVVDKNTGEVTIYNKVRDFYKDFKLHVRANNLNDAIVFFKEKHPNHEVSYQRNSTVGPYRVLNIETNESLIFDSIKATAAYIETNPI